MNDNNENQPISTRCTGIRVVCILDALGTGLISRSHSNVYWKLVIGKKDKARRERQVARPNLGQAERVVATVPLPSRPTLGPPFLSPAPAQRPAPVTLRKTFTSLFSYIELPDHLNHSRTGNTIQQNATFPFVLRPRKAPRTPIDFSSPITTN